MTEAAGILALAGFSWLALFQFLLALGFPLGAMAWGGAHRVLPSTLRLASALSAVLAGVGALTVAQTSGLGPSVLPDITVRPLLGAFAALFALSVVGNAASQSLVERLHGVPLAAALCLSCAALAWKSGGA